MPFSVLMSVYEREDPRFLTEALTSILFQTLLPSEIVLVKDGPIPEELANVLEEFNAKYPHIFKFIQLPLNKGLGTALNIGLAACSNELVARMDTDDVSYPERFEKQMSFLNENPHISVLGTSIQEFENVPNDLNRYRHLSTSAKQIRNFAHYRNPLNHPTVFFRKSDIVDVGSYQDFPLFEDYYLWIRVLQSGYNIANLSEPLLHFRVGNDMIGRRHGMEYLKKEFRFLIKADKLGFIHKFQFLFLVLTKLPLRVVPKQMLEFIYKRWLR